MSLAVAMSQEAANRMGVDRAYANGPELDQRNTAAHGATLEIEVLAAEEGEPLSHSLSAIKHS